MRSKTFLFFKYVCLSLLFATLGAGKVVAQSITDSVFLVPEVVVTASRHQHFGNDIKTEVFTQDNLGSYAGEPLSRFLTNNTAINVKAYGAGGALANVTLRGTSSSHVQVNWNGFPINSVTLGSCDFSMIPAGGFDQVSVVYGASGALYGSGTFGGAINLDNDLKPAKNLSGSAMIGYQSLKARNGSVSFHIGTNKLAWGANVWGANSDNQFTYYDYINQYQRTQTDGAWNDFGTIQNAVLRLSPSSTLEAGVWYQVKKYNIPSHIGSTSYEAQKDSTLKLFLAYKTHGNRWGLQIKTAMFNDFEHYWQKASAQSSVNSIDSHISAHQWYSDANFRYYLQSYLSIDAGITGSYIAADVSSYGDTKCEKTLAAFAGLKYDNHRLSWQVALRKEWCNDFHSDPLASLGAAWQIIPGRWALRANASQKFRKPTFNDLYWEPGGNLNLNPESGYSAEIGSLAILWERGRTKLSTDLNFYWSQVKDMIIWRPAGAYWAATNYQRVHSMGMEPKLILDILQKHWQYHSSLTMTLNHSIVRPIATDKEVAMTYSPRVITAWQNQVSVGLFDFTLWHHFTADRFYDDNALLDPYQTIDIQAGAKIPVAKGILGMHITVFNLTNTTYELIRLYPMPGRYWSAKMSYTF